MIGLAGIATVAFLGLQLGSVMAADDITLTLSSSADGTSTATDAMQIESMRFDQARAALQALPGSDATVTVPTTIVGFSDVEINDVTVQADPASASVAFTGRAERIFGPRFPADVDVLVVADWDETDNADNAPRLIVSVQLADETLGDLLGIDDGSIVSTIPLPIGALTVTNSPDATIPMSTETLLDPSSLPANARAYFERIDGADLRDTLPMRGAINVQAAIGVGDIDPAVNAALGFASDDRLHLDGSIGITLDDFPASGADAISGLSLRAAAPTITLPGEVTDALGLGSTSLDATFEIAVTDAETPDDPTDDALRIFLGADVGLSAPLPDIDVDLAVEVTTTRSGAATVLMSAGIGEWIAPFGATDLTFDDLNLTATFESSPAGSPTINVTLDAEATIAEKNVTIGIEGNLADPFSATIDVGLNDSVELGELLDGLGVDREASKIPGHILDSSFGPAALHVEVGTDSGGGFELSASMSGDFELYILPTSAEPIAATLFADFSIGGTSDVTVGIRPNGGLAMSDVTPGGDADFALDSADSVFAFVVSTAGIDLTLGELDAPAAAFFAPLFDNDDDADIDIPVGASVFGTVELPTELAAFANNTLGLDSTVELSGTVPFGGGEPFRLSLALELDPATTPEWVEAGNLSLELAASPAGVTFDLQGSLTARLRAGIAPDIAADLADLGIDVLSDAPVDPDFDCPGAGRVQAVTGTNGTEYRCFDSLTFTVGMRLNVLPTRVSANLTLGLDTAVMGDDYGWNPFGLSWVTINQLTLELGLQWEASAPPPGISVTMGFAGDTELAGTDIFAAFKVSVQPLPYPPFVIIEPEGFRLASDRGLELDDFFEIQNEIAQAAVAVSGGVAPPAFTAADLSIPNVALRNLDLSFSVNGAPSLCIPRGLYISADIYLDPTDDPAARPLKCEADGTPVPPPPGSSCDENADNGCLAGARIAVTKTGFEAVATINGFDLGPIVFEGSHVDLALSPTEQHLIVYGGATFDPIGRGQLQMSLERAGSGIDAFFAGRVGIGPSDDPYITALVEGRAAFDIAAMGSVGIELRFVLDAENLDIDQLTDEFDIVAREAIELSADEIIEFVRQLDIAIADFESDPVGYVNSELDALGVTIPPQLQPLVDALAELVAQGVVVGEDAILRGEFPGLPAVGSAKVIGCPISNLTFFNVGGKCFTTRPMPIGGADLVKQCVLSAAPLLSTNGRCYFTVPEGVPAGGVDGSDGCPIPLFKAPNGRCYVAGLFPTELGFPNNGYTAVLGCVDILEGNPVFRYDDRCYNQPPIPGIDQANDAELICPIPLFEGSDGLCYNIPPIDTVGLCDALDLIDGVELAADCTRTDIIDELIEPAIYAAAGYSIEFVESTTEVLDRLADFRVECAEFDLLLDGSTLDIDLSITAGLRDVVRTFSVGWSLDDDLVANATTLLDGLRGATAEGCTPVEFTDFAEEVFDDDGGELLNPSTAVTDSYAVDEGQTIVVRPFDNDDNATTSQITTVTVIGTSAAPVGFRAAAPPVDGVSATVGPDGRTIIFTGTDDLAPGETRTVDFEFTSTNTSGIATRSTGEVTLIGTNDAPIANPDDATLDLRVADSVGIDVLGNDTDTEDGVPGTIGGVATASTLGCPTSDGLSMTFSATSCAGDDGVHDFLAEGQVLVERFAYAAVDSANAVGAANVTMTVIGANDAPMLDDIRISRRIVDKGIIVTVTARVVDLDQGDTHTVVIDWGDGSSTSVDLGARRFVRSQHTFASSGSITVGMTVTDAAGAVGAADSSVFVRSTAALNAATVDVDGDGFSAEVDCNDLDAAINPGATEIPGNGIDENCNGNVDDVVELADDNDGGGPVDGTTGDTGDGTAGGNGNGGGPTDGNGGGTTGVDDGGAIGVDAPRPAAPTHRLPATGATIKSVLLLGALAVALGLTVRTSPRRRRRTRPTI